MRRCFVLFGLLVACSSTSSATPGDAATDAAAEAEVAHDGGHDVAIDETGFTFGGPKTLQETGLYADFAARTIAADVIAYTVRYELWSDGVTKKRWFKLPVGTKIDTTDPDHWVFPVGTKLWKEFSTPDMLRPFETRYLIKLPSGKWDMVGYGWQHDADVTIAAPGGLTDIHGTKHDIPSTEQCHICHDGVKDGAIGPSLYQLSKQQIDGKPALAELFARGLLDKKVDEIDPPGAGTVQDALGYLHANCGHCHNDVGLWSTVVPMRLRLRASDTTPEGTWTYTTTLGKKAKHVLAGGVDTIVVAGNPDVSQLFVRMGKRDLEQMPPLGTEDLDAKGLATIKSWILGVK